MCYPNTKKQLQVTIAVLPSIVREIHILNVMTNNGKKIHILNCFWCVFLLVIKIMLSKVIKSELNLELLGFPTSLTVQYY